MSAVPQGAFATFKIKQNLQKPNESEWEWKPKTAILTRNDSVSEQPPLKYNSKLMNSVWGLYNRYSVHNFKKKSESVGFDIFVNQRF